MDLIFEEGSILFLMESKHKSKEKLHVRENGGEFAFVVGGKDTTKLIFVPIDSRLGRQRRVKQRVFDAQNLDDQIKANIEVISRFLRAARRDEHKEFTFPDGPGPDKLLGSLQAVRRALNGVETIVRGQQDLEETESDTDDEADKTIV
ncbi:hypothetical protein DFH07DRAFT_780469 [Mycena maculata]|uniref:Uncharacterized protein n=1 Tax=Mycena maculata TaxID=230809 RepID=A0AAD7I325_9AGAR|nr:hypothetical protein DFH07DRAFT_780469 [Mycena maculata]